MSQVSARRGTQDVAGLSKTPRAGRVRLGHVTAAEPARDRRAGRLRTETTAVYLAPAEFIDSGHPEVTAKAGELCASIGSRRDADVSNHLASPRLLAAMGTDIFAWHGYSQLFLGGRWVSVSPTFDPEACRRAGVPPLDFDGEHDALLQSFDAPGATMAYLKPHGFFHDVPARFLAAEMQRLYPFAADHGITRFQAASKA